MVISIVARLPKCVISLASPWRSRVPTLLQTSCRCITLGLEHSRFSSKASGSMDHFIGTWVQETVTGLEKFLDAFDVEQHMRDYIISHKTTLVYSRHGDLWTVEQGMLGTAHNYSYKIKLGRKYVSLFMDGTPLNSLVIQDGKRLKEKHETVSTAPVVLEVVSEVSGDTLTSTLKIKDTVMKKTYAKQ